MNLSARTNRNSQLPAGCSRCSESVFDILHPMRYLVRPRVRPDWEQALLDAIENETLGAGSSARRAG